MMPDAIDLLLVYLLALLCLIEMSAGVAAFCTLGRKSPKGRQTWQSGPGSSDGSSSGWDRGLCDSWDSDGNV
jgi:hypothetical protein